MKKKNLLCISALSLLALALPACSNDDDVLNGAEVPEVATGEQVIVLDMQDTDVLSTKSRPLYSTTNQGAELVTDVQLLIFKMSDEVGKTPMTLEQVIPIKQWDQLSSPYNYGQKYSIKLGEALQADGTTSKKLSKNNSYTIIAVGQDESNPDADPVPFKIVDNASGSLVSALTASSFTNTTWNAASTPGNGFLKTVALTSYGNVAEIFSGTSDPVTLSGDFDGGFSASVLLKRQVAGVLGYFSKIPAFVSNGGSEQTDIYKNYDAVKAIRLVASARNTQIDLTNVLGDQKDDATEVGKENVVNGFTPSETKDAKFKVTADASGDDDAFTVYEIDLTKWFKTASTASSATDASYWFGTFTDASSFETNGIPSLGEEFNSVSTTWQNAFDSANDNPRVADNSVLAGEFLIPFNRVVESGVHTFELQLLGGEGNKVLKSWNVKLDDMSIDQTQGDSEYVFNIYRNHLYQIGQRGSGDDPTNLGTDPDKPQPLDKDQELTIKINDQWEFIHDMEIE